MFVLGKPHSTGSSERIQLSGTYNVRKGKMQLPVNRWTRRQVILCGTCLIVSSVKDSVSGKMHVLPLIGGKVSKAGTLTRFPALVRAFWPFLQEEHVHLTRRNSHSCHVPLAGIVVYWSYRKSSVIGLQEKATTVCPCSVLECRW